MTRPLRILTCLSLLVLVGCSDDEPGHNNETDAQVKADSATATLVGDLAIDESITNGGGGVFVDNLTGSLSEVDEGLFLVDFTLRNASEKAIKIADYFAVVTD